MQLGGATLYGPVMVAFAAAAFVAIRWFALDIGWVLGGGTQGAGADRGRRRGTASLLKLLSGVLMDRRDHAKGRLWQSVAVEAAFAFSAGCALAAALLLKFCVMRTQS